MGCRAGIVVTGTEVLTGRVADRNGPWLAEQLRLHGVDVGHVVVVGDRPDDLSAALRFLQQAAVQLIITTGGLGPTADDLTAAVVGRFQQRESRLDPALEARIAAIIDRLNAGRAWHADPAATAAGVGKQAMVPAGATVLEPVGTAPGLIVPARDGESGPPVVVLPGPPGELQAMWPLVLTDPGVQAALADRAELRQQTIRLWATPESELARTLREHEPELDGLEITTCLRDGELEIVTRFAAAAQPVYDAFAGVIASEYAAALLSTDGSTIDDLVAAALLARGLTIATAESCTSGLLAGRLGSRAGASAYLLGGVVAYDNRVKSRLLDVPAGLIEQFGAVSAEVADAMAEGVRSALGADVGVGITGVAGPGGGTQAKPVGLVELCVITPDGNHARRVTVSGNRDAVRARAVLIALHLVRSALL
jgi:nicotinamide-nucleotide amidase